MCVSKDLMCLSCKLGTRFGQVVRFGEVGGQVVDFDGLVDAVANRLPVAKPCGLSRFVAAVQFPVEIVPPRRVATQAPPSAVGTMSLISLAGRRALPWVIKVSFCPTTYVIPAVVPIQTASGPTAMTLDGSTGGRSSREEKSRLSERTE